MTTIKDLRERSYQREMITSDNVLRLPKMGNTSYGKYKIHFVKESNEHPARMVASLAEWIIKNYSSTNDKVLDPMAGIGTTLVIGKCLNRRIYGIEYEKKFFKILLQNISNANNSLFNYIFFDEVENIINGDARHITDLFPQIKFDLITFSPPYVPRRGQKPIDMRENDNKRGYGSEHKGFRGWYSDDIRNIGNPRKYEDYLSQMKDIYSQCYLALSDEGNMVLVIKNSVRDGKTIRLDEDTIKMCEEIGFKLNKRWYYEIPFTSPFMKMNIEKWMENHSNSIHPYSLYEDILIFKRKGEET